MDTSLKREPKIENPGRGSRFYDSVEGSPTKFREFVIYEKRRALVECIITFTRKSNNVCPPLVTAAPKTQHSEATTTQDIPSTPQTALKSPASVDTTPQPASVKPDSSLSNKNDDENEEEDDHEDDDDDDGDDGSGTDTENSDGDSTDGDTDDDFDDANEDADTDGDADDDFVDANEDPVEEDSPCSGDEECTVKIDTGDADLDEKIKEFMVQTEEKDQLVARLYVIMEDSNVESAVNQYNTVHTVEFTPEEDEEAERVLQELTEKLSVARPSKTELDAMSAEDMEAVVTVLIDHFGELVGLDKSDPENPTLARKYLEATNWQCDLALLAYYEELYGL